MTLEGPGGADTDLAAIKRLFYDVDGNARPPDEASLEPGWRSLCRDMPLCRWPWEILPQHQRVVVVHEPQYILMFEKVLAGPAPHEYVHLLLPGGTDELGSDEFALRPGSKGAMAGTLVRIVASLRDTVQTATPGLKVEGLVLVVQGLARVHVTQQTQALPYAKADVLLLPDAEALGAAARASRRWLRRSGALARTDPAVRTRLALEAAAAEEAYWQRHELCNASLVASPTPKLCLLSSSHAEGRADGAAAAAVEAMERVPLLSPPPAADEGRVDAADLTVLLPDGAADSAFRNRSAWHSEWVRRVQPGRRARGLPRAASEPLLGAPSPRRRRGPLNRGGGAAGAAAGAGRRRSGPRRKAGRRARRRRRGGGGGIASGARGAGVAELGRARRSGRPAWRGSEQTAVHRRRHEPPELI